MKVEQYFLCGDALAYSGAVNQIMVLFEVLPATCPLGSDVNPDQPGGFLPENAVLIRNRILPEKDAQIALLTEGFFRCAAHKPGRVVRQATAAIVPGEHDREMKRLLMHNVLYIMRKITGTDPGPWGILRGVRPTKIVHRLLDKGLSKQQITEKMTADYAVNAAKAELVTKIALYQRPFLLPAEGKACVSIYIGIPYCPSRCLYCSFPAYVRPENPRELLVFLNALEQDIDTVIKLIERYGLQVETVYIGGGTPTSLPPASFARVLDRVSRLITAETKEFTVEAGRPDSIDDGHIEALCRYGVTRVSVNPQTMQQKTLNRIGRRHTVEDIIKVFGKFRKAGIPVINMDVIAGLPGEDEQDMEDTMQKISQLGPENLTVHTLALKKGSLLKANLAEYDLPDEKTTARMLSIADGYASTLGMNPYYMYRQKYMTGNLENIGYCQQGTECLYNIQMMEERQTVIGIGPAAATKAVDRSTWRLESRYNAKDVLTYINRLPSYLNERSKLLTRLFAHREEET
ncbi:radical sam [Lucifera butyrica]|uniref:Radical sam n=1 Tax=Lucifera butyrica TaxID=1351585 RepID=A0A498R0J9_9FIRM|nr:coproporphyrinogen dehydrogenase HemZ [Lucifera butyrica]VBB06036.1 radical sam [Lucifera butyrica]